MASVEVGVAITVDGIADPGLPCEQSRNTPANLLYGESLESEEFCFDNDAEKKGNYFHYFFHTAFLTCTYFYSHDFSMTDIYFYAA
jgi:hypothetical protein